MDAKPHGSRTRRKPIEIPIPKSRSAVANGTRHLLGHLDGRSAQVRRWRDLQADICRDAGGDVSTAELEVIRSACGLVILREALDARILKDEPIDIAVYATITNALRRQFETIGLKRVPRDVTPTLEEYVRTTYGDESPSITGGETPTFDRDGPIPEATSSSSISDEDGDEEE